MDDIGVVLGDGRDDGAHEDVGLVRRHWDGAHCIDGAFRHGAGVADGEDHVVDVVASKSRSAGTKVGDGLRVFDLLSGDLAGKGGVVDVSVLLEVDAFKVVVDDDNVGGAGRIQGPS